MDYDLHIYQGATFTQNLSLTDVSGLPLNLTNCQISGILKRYHSDTGFKLDLGASVVNASGGVINVTVAASGTSACPVGFMFYDIDVQSGSFVWKPLRGKASIYPEII